MLNDIQRTRIFFLTLLTLMMVFGGIFSFAVPTIAAEPLDRFSGPLTLGMSVDALQKAVQVDEKKDAYLGLMAGERYFIVRPGSLPPGVQKMDCTSFGGKVYKITLLYTPDFIRKISWETLMVRYSDRYGKVPLKQAPLGERKVLEISRWEDPATIFILKRERTATFPGSKSPPPVPVIIETYLDQALWQERFQLEVNQNPLF
ncbi:MAG: hypothetical protein HZA19_02290 [Nitrospirae bacterium]|nr:hypothetical protein [Nitrospirota bacterium]